jgi:uncharacterized protein
MSGSAPREGAPRSTIDTNLFVSGMISRGSPKQLLDAWDRGSFLLVLSQTMVEEISDVLRRPYIRTRYQLTDKRIIQLETGITRFADVLADVSPLPADLMVRDPKDEHVLQAALSAKAHYLVTGDDDLLALDGHPALGSLQIIKVNEFLRLLEL